jgi:Ca-activated chloride channel homolog
MSQAAPRWASLSLACLISALAYAPAAFAQAERRKPSRQLGAEVDLVSVLTSVLDSTGRPLADLPEEAFEVDEEGVPQKIARFEPDTSQPLDLALMIDTSLSALAELRFEREAAARFIRQVVRPGDGLAVFEFADAITELAGFSADIPALEEAVRRIEPGAGTALYDAVYLGSLALERRPADRRRVIVLVTDAGETTSRSDFETARRAALRAGALLYTVLVRAVKSDAGRNLAGEHALVTITDVTGGGMYYPDRLEELDATFDRINRELRTQYLLGYYPNPRPPAGSFRHIEVRVKPAAGSRGGYFLRYRKGYFAPGPAE